MPVSPKDEFELPSHARTRTRTRTRTRARTSYYYYYNTDAPHDESDERHPARRAFGFTSGCASNALQKKFTHVKKKVDKYSVKSYKRACQEDEALTPPPTHTEDV